MNYTLEELLAVELSRHLCDGEVGFIDLGTAGKDFIRSVGIPVVACRLAQLKHAPNFTVCIGSLIDPLLEGESVPESLNDEDLIRWPCHGQIPAEGILSAFCTGRMKIGFGTADQNGCGTVCGFIKARKLLSVVHQNKKIFSEKFLKSAASDWIFTQLGVLNYNPGIKKYHLVSVNPGFMVQDVLDNVCFPIEVPQNVLITSEPSQEDLTLIRGRIDPVGKWLNALITGEPAKLENEVKSDRKALTNELR